MCMLAMFRVQMLFLTETVLGIFVFCYFSEYLMEIHCYYWNLLELNFKLATLEHVVIAIFHTVGCHPKHTFLALD